MNNVFTSKDNFEIYIHPEASHPHREDLIEEAIKKVEINNRPFIRETVDFGRVIGEDHLVETTEGDHICFFDRNNSGYKSRMVLDREPEKTTKATVIIAKCGPEDGVDWNGKYVLITLFEGDPGMPEPYGRNEGNEDAIKFWETHALVPTDTELEKIKKGE